MTGKIIQIIGPVVDVEMDEAKDDGAEVLLPAIYNALHVTNKEGKAIVLEVAHHIGMNRVRTIALSSTDGLSRGMEVKDTGAPISVPVGSKVLGRMFNVLGEAIDNKGELEEVKRWSIHRKPPAFTEQSTKVEVFETGIKVIDLLAPFIRGGKVGLFGGAGVGKTVLLMELI